MRNAGLEETQAGIKIAGRNLNNLRYADDTTLMAESEEELKGLLMKVEVESEKGGLIGTRKVNLNWEESLSLGTESVGRSLQPTSAGERPGRPGPCLSCPLLAHRQSSSVSAHVSV